MARWFGRVLGLVVASDIRLAASVIGSLPRELLSGFVLVGPPALRPLARLDGCRGHLDIELAPSSAARANADLAALADGAVIVPVDDAGSDFVNTIRAGDLAVTPLATAPLLDELRNKWSFFQLCGRLDLPTPPTQLFARKEQVDIDRVFAVLGAPVVFKPTNESGGKGVVVVESRQDFETRVLRSPAYDFAPLMAQAFVPGCDLDISLLALDGEILNSAVQTRSDKAVLFTQNPALAGFAETLVKATSYSGFAHIDARLRPDGGVELIECNARTWISLRAATWCGLNFIRSAVAVALTGAPIGPRVMPARSSPLTGLDFLKGLAAHPGRWAGYSADQRQIIGSSVSALIRQAEGAATNGWRKRPGGSAAAVLPRHELAQGS